MNKKKTTFYIVASTIALLIVLLIQLNWILESAKMKEAMFNEKAQLILTKTAESLAVNREACQNLELEANDNERLLVDSLFTHYMKQYNFHVNYYFEIVPSTPEALTWTNFNFTSQSGSIIRNTGEHPPGCYTASVETKPGKNKMELKLVIPGKDQFIKAELGVPFFTSVFLLLVVLILSWRTIRSLDKEQKIAAATVDFLNNMTHEFKTPLTNIALAGNMIRRDLPSIQQHRLDYYTDIIIDENNRLRNQVEQVLGMSAIERGELSIHKQNTDLHQVIRDAIHTMKIQLENRQGIISLELHADPSVISGDPFHLTNIFSNLIDNAIKYSPGPPRITIQTGNSKDHIHITVSDQGTGIDKQYHKRVFDKFFRIPSGDVHNVRGTGIGLAWLKVVVEMHKGTLSLQSEKGKGTAIKINLPYA